MAENPPSLRLYVWRGVLCDWTCGMICVLAETPEQAELLARRELEEASSGFMSSTLTEPEIFEAPAAVSVHGGG